MSHVADLFATMDYGPAPEAADAALAWIAGHGDGFSLFIDGQWTAPAAGGSFETRNPATGAVLARVAVADASDVDRAVSAAAAAFPAWSARSGHERARILYAIARLLQKQSRIFAVLESLDNGKPIRESRDIDIPLAARHFYHHAGWAQLIDREFPDQRPIGVCGQIVPWNFPLLMLAWKIAPALAAGNTVVLKPAEYTSLTALMFAELCTEAGMPPGVVNIVTGPGTTGEAIVDHPGVAKIAFTGSTAVGRRIRERTAGTAKRLSLELGGKSPFIVLDDADLDSAVEGLVDGIWFNQGEVCCAGSRLLVEESVEGRLVAKLKARLEKFRIGDPLDKAIDMGALADPIQHRRVSKLVDAAVAEGATRWQPATEMPAQGSYFAPTLLTDIGTGNTAWREEIFGPVLAVMSFRTVAEATALANNTRYGLAASIWSENINRALDLASRVDAGVVWINGANQFDAAAPFGGYKESGFGREGGRSGMAEYLRPAAEWLGTGDAVAAIPAIADAGAPDGIDRTPKNLIGGKQTRPDGGGTRAIATHDGRLAGRVGDGNRKDIRDAVEAAVNAGNWHGSTGHLRAQILYFIAENLSARADEFAERLALGSGKSGAVEVAASIDRLFTYAAWADKYDGAVHDVPSRQITLAMREPMGVIGIVCPDPDPLLNFVSLVAPAIAMGNRVVVVPSERWPLAATDFYQILETSDVPAGVVNIVTGDRDTLARTLADHDALAAIWYHGSADGSRMVEQAAAANLKRSWTNAGRTRDWYSTADGEGPAFLARATQVKAIWVPYGD